MEKRNIEITLATAKEWYKGNNEVLKNLARQAFEEKELQKSITRVKSWEDFCEKYNKIETEYFIGVESHIVKFDRNNKYIDSDRNIRHINSDRNLLATKEDAEAFLALMQLKRLRDQWWEALNWKPDYTNYKYKYAIVVDKNEININTVITYHKFLIFSTKEIAEDFLNCFKNLIEKAKELI